jgi:hypothetical protein
MEMLNVTILSRNAACTYAFEALSVLHACAQENIKNATQELTER